MEKGLKLIIYVASMEGGRLGAVGRESFQVFNMLFKLFTKRLFSCITCIHNLKKKRKEIKY